MNPSYVPIVRAKKGEFDALLHLEEATAKKILPLLELPRFKDAKRFQDSPHKIESYLYELADKIASTRKGMKTHVDISTWAPNATTEGGEHVLNYIHNRLNELGVTVYPVVGYDRWDDIEYQKAISNLNVVEGIDFCIRLESDAIQDIDDIDYFLERITDILDTLFITPEQCSILVDFRDITKRAIIDIHEEFEKVLSALDDFNFKYISLAGCSLSGNIADAVKEKNSTGIVLRKEMIVWRASRKESFNTPIIFGDYGIRSPSLSDDIIAPDANGKIRYTVAEQYFIVRGYSKRIGEKGKQNHKLAMELVNSTKYLGPSFSWGDEQIMKCSEYEIGPGNASNWIAYDTNHHIKAVLFELFEFEQQLKITGINNSIEKV